MKLVMNEARLQSKLSTAIISTTDALDEFCFQDLKNDVEYLKKALHQLNIVQSRLDFAKIKKA